MEIIISILSATGLLATIGLILKWLLKSMSGYVDRLSRNFDTYTARLSDGFTKEADRVVGGLTRVEESLSKHIESNRIQHQHILERLDKDDVRQVKVENVILGLQEDLTSYSSRTKATTAVNDVQYLASTDTNDGQE